MDISIIFQFLKELAANNTRIRDQVAVAESQLCQENLLTYFADGRKSGKPDAGTDYESFVDEVIARISQNHC